LAGVAVPAAVVTIKSPREKASTFSTRTEADGRFKFTKVKPHTFELCVEAPGFKSKCLTSLTVESGEQKSLGSVTLEVEGCCGAVEVGPPPPHL
jgi:hypothetical protein